MSANVSTAKAERKEKRDVRRALFDVDFVSPVSPDAVAMGEIHNLVVSRIEAILSSQSDPAERIVAAIRHAQAAACISEGEERTLVEIVRTLDPEKTDFGLETVKRLRQRLIDDRASDIAIATASVAVSSTEFGLTTLDGSEPQAIRRRRWLIALFDIGGAIIGGAVGGVGGAGVGAGLASSIANQTLPDN